MPTKLHLKGKELSINTDMHEYFVHHKSEPEITVGHNNNTYITVYTSKALVNHHSRCHIN